MPQPEIVPEEPPQGSSYVVDRRGAVSVVQFNTTAGHSVTPFQHPFSIGSSDRKKCGVIEAACVDTASEEGGVLMGGLL